MLSVLGAPARDILKSVHTLSISLGVRCATVRNCAQPGWQPSGSAVVDRRGRAVVRSNRALSCSVDKDTPPRSTSEAPRRTVAMPAEREPRRPEEVTGSRRLRRCRADAATTADHTRPRALARGSNDRRPARRGLSIHMARVSRELSAPCDRGSSSFPRLWSAGRVARVAGATVRVLARWPGRRIRRSGSLWVLSASRPPRAALPFSSRRARA